MLYTPRADLERAADHVMLLMRTMHTCTKHPASVNIPPREVIENGIRGLITQLTGENILPDDLRDVSVPFTNAP